MIKKSYSLLFPLLLVLVLLSGCKSSKPNQQSSTSAPAPKQPVVEQELSDDQKKLVKAARSYIGTKYKYGGMSKRGTDCSGLIFMSYSEIGKSLPRTSNEQSKIGTRIYIGELQVGDLVFFGAKPRSKKITHVGLITEINGKSVTFVHASTSRGVIENDLSTEYYHDRYIMAVRPL